MQFLKSKEIPEKIKVQVVKSISDILAALYESFRERWNWHER